MNHADAVHSFPYYPEFIKIKIVDMKMRVFDYLFTIVIFANGCNIEQSSNSKSVASNSSVVQKDSIANEVELEHLGNQDSLASYFYGRWKIMSYVTNDAPYGIEEKEAKNLINTFISINEDEVQTGAFSCGNPAFRVEAKSLYDYFSGFTTKVSNPFKYDWDAKVEALVIACKPGLSRNDNPYSNSNNYIFTLIRFDDGKIFLDHGNYFFELKLTVR